jgi:hypothetical protein
MALISVAVQRAGHAYTTLEAFAEVILSEAGTGSVDVDLPDGEATVLAYGVDGDLAGVSQGPVTETLALALKATPAFGAFKTSLSPLGTDSLLAVGYYLTWPSESPLIENRVPLAVLTGEHVNETWYLPPVTSFGIPGASYTLIADAMAADASATLAERVRRNVTPGSRLLTWLPKASSKTYQTGSEKYGVPFQMLPDAAVPGANAFILDLFDLVDDKHLWRVVSHQTGTASLEVPLFESLGPKLKPGTTYAVRVDSALNPGRPGAVEEAFTAGSVVGAIYNKPSSSAYRTQSWESVGSPLSIGIFEAPRATISGANRGRSPERAAVERIIREVAGRSK